MANNKHSFYIRRLRDTLLKQLAETFVRVLFRPSVKKEILVNFSPEKSVLADEVPLYHKTPILYLDAMVLVFGDNEREEVSIGLEIKDTWGDLIYDAKLPYEIGHTDYFFLAVPTEMIPCAICIIMDHDADIRRQIGLIDLDHGSIVLFGERAGISDSCNLKTYKEVLRLVMADKGCHFSINVVPGPEKKDFVLFDAHLTNERYLNIALQQYEKRYDYHPYLEHVTEIFDRFKQSPRYTPLAASAECLHK